ncbi:hypothetical protein [Hymenobacter terricola]|uniref:hypothetical protein n=1 Tax=Hymenobacter terricola TaxID=2819236 RepID=UPI001B307D33|nr:hypothetical protein [Hymenobacter terricola]
MEDSNSNKGMFEVEYNRIKSFHLQADYYRNYLNKTLNFEFQEVTKDAAQAYLKKVIGRTIRKMTTGADVIALISVIGELVKSETDGKWFLIERHEINKVVYEPNILTSEGNVYMISGRIVGMVKWKVSRLDNVFIDVHSKITMPIKWDNYSKYRETIMLE